MIKLMLVSWVFAMFLGIAGVLLVLHFLGDRAALIYLAGVIAWGQWGQWWGRQRG